jgi:hypothetical protein
LPGQARRRATQAGTGGRLLGRAYAAARSAPPLQAAAEAGSVDCIAALLQEGAPWNALDDEGYCAGAPGARPCMVLPQSPEREL